MDKYIRCRDKNNNNRATKFRFTESTYCRILHRIVYQRL